MKEKFKNLPLEERVKSFHASILQNKVALNFIAQVADAIRHDLHNVPVDMVYDFITDMKEVYDCIYTASQKVLRIYDTLNQQEGTDGLRRLGVGISVRNNSGSSPDKDGNLTLKGGTGHATLHRR